MVRRVPIIVVSMTVLFLVGCEGIVVPDRIDAIKKDLAAVTVQIKAAEAEDAQYSGGLIKALIGARLATLRHTHALLEQRAKSWTFGIGLRYTVDGRLYQPVANAKDEVNSIDQELGVLRARITAQQVEASRYSGGLIQAMTLASVATMRQTEALLDQRRLLLLYEIPLHVGAPSPSATVAAATAPAIQAAEKEKAWEIVSVDTRVTESNSSWSRFAWKLHIKNKSDQPLRIDALIEFQDKDGFIIDTSTTHGLVLAAHADETFTGYALIKAEGAPRVARTLAKVRRTS